MILADSPLNTLDLINLQDELCPLEAWNPLPHIFGGPTAYGLVRRNDGTLNGGVAYSNLTPPRGGYGSWKGDGTSGYILVPSLQLTTFTLAGWLKTDISAVYNFFSESANGDTKGTALNLNQTSSSGAYQAGTLSAWYHSAAAGPGPGGWNVIGSTPGVLLNGIWCHLAWTLASGLSTLYFNGTVVARQQFALTDINYGSPSKATWGNSITATNKGYVPGNWTGLLQYNRALSSAEVWSLWNDGPLMKRLLKRFDPLAIETPFIQPPPVKKHGHVIAAGRRRHMLQAMYAAEDQYRRQQLSRRAVREKIREAVMEKMRQLDQAEAIHREHMAAKAAWTVLMAEV